jgi:Tol biopolymer transport system component
VSITLLRRPPELGDPPRVDPEALIEEARRRARRRRQRNLIAALAALLGALWLYSLLGMSRAGGEGVVAFGPPSKNATRPNVASPEELSFNANGDIVLVDRNGTRRILVPGIERRRPNGTWLRRQYSGVEWSPDGSKLLALRRGGPSSPALVVLNANSKMAPTIALRALDGRWSPDGTQIAFVRDEPGAGRVLYVAPTDGGTVTRLAEHLQVSAAFSWSADGTELVYAGEDSSGVFVVDASGRRAPRPLPIAAGGVPFEEVATVRWSPDGSLIAFTTGYYVYVVHPDGTRLRHVADAYDFAWSPDSRLLAIAGPAGPGTWGDVAVVRSDGAGLRRIAHCRCDLRGPGSSQAVAWSPDGTRIAYISGRGNTVSTIRPDGSGATVVATQVTRGLTGNWYPWLPLWRPTHAH